MKDIPIGTHDNINLNMRRGEKECFQEIVMAAQNIKNVPYVTKKP